MLRTLFILSLLIPGFFWALFSRFGALVMYVWYACFRPAEFLWIDITDLRLSLVLGVILVVPSLATGRWPDVSHPLSLGALAFFGTMLLAQAGAVAPELGWQWIDFFGRLLVVCLLLVTIVNTRQRLIVLVAVLASSYGFHSSKAGIVFFLTGARFHDGLSGAYIDNNGYALAIVMVIPLLLATSQNMLPGLWLHRLYNRFQPWLKRGFFLSVPLSAGTVIGTFSRSGLLGLAAAVFVFILFQKRKFMPMMGLATMSLLALLFAPVPSEYMDRMQTITTYEETNEESALSRLHFWDVAIDIANANPTGIGLRQFERAYDEYDYSRGYYGRRRSVHSSHFQALAEMGYLGLAFWLFLFAYSAFLGLRIRRRSRHKALPPDESWFMLTYANGILASMAGFFVGGAFIALAVNDITWYTFAILASLDRISKKQLADAIARQKETAVEPTGRQPAVAAVA
ncbi:MAG: hypothetical protein FJW23_04745 [Acidimicrobiia bacterium]|nr:hypothetical protein [Acidimicrobiia bacterium]